MHFFANAGSSVRAPRLLAALALTVSLLLLILASPPNAAAAKYQRVGWQTIMYLNKAETNVLATTTQSLRFPMSIAVWPARRARRTGQCVALWLPLGPAFVYNQPFACY